MLLAELRQARASVDIALFHLTHEDLIDALCFLASRRQIPVRLFTNPDMAQAAQQPILDRLAKHGIEIQVLTLPKAKMHLKFVVVDKATVIIGSANWTRQAFEQNVEDLFVIESTEMASQCLAHLDWLQQKSEPYCPLQTEQAVHPQMNFPKYEEATRTSARAALAAPKPRYINGIQQTDLFFTPDPVGLQMLLAHINEAITGMDVGMYMLSETNLVAALLKKAATCPIRLIADTTMLGGSFLPVLHRLAEAGCEVRIFGSDRANLHLKTAIIDRRHVWTGSANWTPGAMQINVENMLHFDSPALAGYYLAYYDKVYAASRPFATNTPQDTKVKEANLAAYPLPGTGPRADWRNLERNISPAFEVEGWTRYLPDADYCPVLLELLESAHQSILVCMYVMSRQATAAPHLEQVAQALKDAARRGVYVYLVLFMPGSAADRLDQAHSQWADELRAAGVDVRLGIPSGQLHDKLVVVDLAKVLIGSHNWSEGALSGERVYESSFLIVQPRQDIRWAEYVLGCKVIADMRSKAFWEQEAANLRQLNALKNNEQAAFLRELEAAEEEAGAP